MQSHEIGMARVGYFLAVSSISDRKAAAATSSPEVPVVVLSM